MSTADTKTIIDVRLSNMQQYIICAQRATKNIVFTSMEKNNGFVKSNNQFNVSHVMLFKTYKPTLAFRTKKGTVVSVEKYSFL
jgi:hypothetical protein